MHIVPIEFTKKIFLYRSRVGDILNAILTLTDAHKVSFFLYFDYIQKRYFEHDNQKNN